MKSSLRRVAPFPGLRCVFLDRDGVINRKPPEGRYIGAWSDFELLAGAEEAIGKLNRVGCKVLVLSNQRGIALGLYTAEAVVLFHATLQLHLQAQGAHVDGFYFCPHQKGECSCRKPEIGLFKQAQREFPAAVPQRSVMIGDSLSDIEAAVRFGCRSVFVKGDPDTRKPGSETAEKLADGTVESLGEAVDMLLAKL